MSDEKEPESMFDYIWNLLPHDPKVLEEMVRSGVIYTPYTPLQVSKLELKKK